MRERNSALYFLVLGGWLLGCVVFAQHTMYIYMYISAIANELTLTFSALPAQGRYTGTFEGAANVLP